MKREGVEIELIQCDIREMDYHSEFDGVLSWDTSFGYFSDDENENVLKLIARTLRREGKLLLDLYHRDAYIKRHLGKYWERKGNYLILEGVSFDVLRSRLEVRGLLIGGAARTVRVELPFIHVLLIVCVAMVSLTLILRLAGRIYPPPPAISPFRRKGK